MGELENPTGVIQNPVAGQPPQNPPPEGSVTDTPAVNLTDVQIQKIADALANNSEMTKRLKQGLYDHADQRVEQVIAQRIRAIQQTGATPTLDQVAQISAQVQKELQASPSPKQVAQPAEPPAAPQAPVQQVAKPEVEERLDPIAQLAMTRMQKANTIIEDGDPEVSTIKLDGDADEYLQSVDAAIKAKQERLAANATLRVPGVGKGNSEAGAIPEGLSAHELIKLGYSQRKR